MKLLFDIETDGLDPTVIHCVAWSVQHTGSSTWSTITAEVAPFVYFRELFEEADELIGHNIISFDVPVVKKLLEVEPKSGCKIVDTFVLSRLRNYLQFNTHSLEEWGKYLSFPKGTPPTDWSICTPDMLHYCMQDVKLNLKVYQDLEKFIEDPKNTEAIDLELRFEELARQITERGFPFDFVDAVYLLQEMELLQEEFLEEFEHIPPKKVIKKEVKFRTKKDGTLHATTLAALAEGGKLWSGEKEDIVRVYEEVPFNPNAHKDRIDLLNANGWKPKDKSDAHIKAIRSGTVSEYHKKYGWKVNEENLSTLPKSAEPSAKKLAQYLTITGRINMLRQWVSAYNEETSRVHPKLWGIGAWTQRCSHSNPNEANLPSVWKGTPESPVEEIKAKFDSRFRALFLPEEDDKLVGVDAKSIQLRILAYYMKDPEFTKEVLEGDIHTANMKALGSVCKSRDVAKTFIYAWVLKAGIPKLASILDCSIPEAKRAKESFEKRWAKGLKNVKAFERDAERKGYFIGLDGRKVYFPSAHVILAGMLQSGEAIIMKKTMVQYSFRYHAFVHDEFQFSLWDWILKIEVETLLEKVGKRLSEELFGTYDYSPLIEYEVKEGENWAETH